VRARELVASRTCFYRRDESDAVTARYMMIAMIAIVTTMMSSTGSVGRSTEGTLSARCWHGTAPTPAPRSGKHRHGAVTVCER
jgi:hypothetical protein